ncbi:MAG: hypothetical protein Ct9H300mP11_10340 [Chloroflexota bacterium]|nr:MAG: hypothetical protein Ct9H300mP11_10340 [Chloroflexota bacterium]
MGFGSKYPEAQIDLNIVNTYQAYRVDANSQVVSVVGQALAEMGLKPVLESTGGGSDANVFLKGGYGHSGRYRSKGFSHHMGNGFDY